MDLGSIVHDFDRIGPGSISVHGLRPVHVIQGVSKTL